MSNLLFPIETLSRELDSRLVLGAMLFRPGRHIFIGDKRLVHSIGSHIEGGVYVGKFVFHRVMRGNRHHFERLKSHRMQLVFLDEEGGIWQGEEDEWRRILATRLDPTLFSRDELFLTWGEFQKEFYQSRYPGAAEQRFLALGHPRFDLYKPEWHAFFAEESARLTQRYGDFLLLNTNLSVANHVNGYRSAFTQVMGYYNADGSVNPHFIDYWELKMQVLASFVSLVHRLTERVPQRIVVRPHPSEDLEFYRRALAGLTRVDVVREGSVSPWLHACRALLHDSCTTAIEAHLAGKPVINWRPGGSAEYEHALANSIGVRCRTVDEVVAVLNGEEAGEALCDREGRLRKMLDNFNGDSLTRTVEVLDAQLEQAAPASRARVSALRWRAGARRLEDRMRHLARLRAGRMRGQAAKFPGMQADYVRQKLAYLESRVGYRLPYRLFGDNLLVIG